MRFSLLSNVLCQGLCVSLRVALCVALCVAFPSVFSATEKTRTINLNPAHGDPVYQAWSVFAPDLAVGEALGPKVVVVFHGLRSAGPNGFYKRIREFFKSTHHVIGINYDYLDPQGTVAHLKTLASGQLTGREVTVLGSSLGGYWANWFAQYIGAFQVGLINPVIDPAVWINQHLGKVQHNPRRNIDFIATVTDQREYAQMATTPNLPMRRLVILTRDDDNLDSTIAERHFAGRADVQMVIYDHGGHTLNLKKHPAREVIIDFVLSRRAYFSPVRSPPAMRPERRRRGSCGNTNARALSKRLTH